MTQENYQQRERPDAPWALRTHLLPLTLAAVALLGLAPVLERVEAGGMEATFSPSASFDYKEVRVAGGGAITGVVRLDGAPAGAPLPVSKDQATCGNELRDPSASVSADGGLQWAFVYLEGVKEGKPGAKAPVRIVNKGCLYVPFVQGGLTGAPMVVENDDSILHNVHTYEGRRTLWNLGLPIQGMKIPKRLPARPGVIQFKCDLHEWMNGFIHVMEHPYFATTDAAGKFQIADVPPGTYTLVVQHPRWGERRLEAEVSGGQQTELDVRLSGESSR